MVRSVNPRTGQRACPRHLSGHHDVRHLYDLRVAVLSQVVQSTQFYLEIFPRLDVSVLVHVHL